MSHVNYVEKISFVTSSFDNHIDVYHHPEDYDYKHECSHCGKDFYPLNIPKASIQNITRRENVPM